jgi:cytochrome P450
MVRTYPFSEPVDLEVDPTYAQVRRDEPVCRVHLPYGGDGWLVTSHAGVRTVLSDPRFSRAAAAGREVPRIVPYLLPPGLLASMDPPEHTRIRKLVSGAFTMRRIAELRPRIEQITHDLLDALQPPVDLLPSFAVPLPTIVIGEMLGVPPADQEQLRDWTDRILRVTPMADEELANAAVELTGYLSALLAERRKNQTDDVMSALLDASDEHGRLSERELVLLVFFILTASYDTTTKQLANSIYVLLNHPDKWAALHADLELVPAAVDELLRYIPLVSAGSNTRIAIEDVQVEGVTIRAGEAVIFSAASANRDPSVFERPDELDFSRTENRHLSFSHGLHHCLGTHLARLTLQIALATLVKRCPDLRLAGPVTFKTGRLLRGPETLPVAW